MSECCLTNIFTVSERLFVQWCGYSVCSRVRTWYTSSLILGRIVCKVFPMHRSCVHTYTHIRCSHQKHPHLFLLVRVFKMPTKLKNGSHNSTIATTGQRSREKLITSYDMPYTFCSQLCSLTRMCIYTQQKYPGSAQCFDSV